MASIGTVGKIDGNDISKMVIGASVSARPGPSSAPPEATNASAQISATGKLQHALAQVVEATRRLSQADTWRAAKASSSAPEVLDATTQQADTERKIEVQVEQLALHQSTVAPLYSPLATPIGLGTLDIELGSWNSSYSSFTTNPNWPKAKISTGPGDTSIQRLRDKINAAGIGVVANVISDPTGSYLLLRASAPGKENGFKISVEVDPSATPTQVQSLQALGFDPAASSGGMQLVQSAQDAIVKVNGERMRSSSNFIEDVAPGVDITAKKASDTPVTVSVQPDRDVAKSLVENFVNSYNELQSQLSQRQPADPMTLAAATAVQQGIESIWSDQAAHAQLRQNMAELGIQLNENKQLTLDASQLDRGVVGQTAAPAQMAQLSRSLAQASPEFATSSAPTGPSARDLAAPAAPSTSALFRQAVLEQYTNNMYAEDAH
ncbi:MAG: flagellar filament capping protein FliD [Acidobacteriota bacterium]